MFSFIRSALTSHALLAMALSAVTLTYLAGLVWGIAPLEALGFVCGWLTLPDVANALWGIDIHALGPLRLVPLIASVLIVSAWCVDVVREGEVRPNMVPSRRGTFITLALVLASPDLGVLAWLCAGACVAPALTAVVARYEPVVALEVFALRFGDLLVSMFALTLYPVSWLVERR